MALSTGGWHWMWKVACFRIVDNHINGLFGWILSTIPITSGENTFVYIKTQLLNTIMNVSDANSIHTIFIIIHHHIRNNIPSAEYSRILLNKHCILSAQLHTIRHAWSLIVWTLKTHKHIHTHKHNPTNTHQPQPTHIRRRASRRVACPCRAYALAINFRASCHNFISIPAAQSLFTLLQNCYRIIYGFPAGCWLVRMATAANAERRHCVCLASRIHRKALRMRCRRAFATLAATLPATELSAKPYAERPMPRRRRRRRQRWHRVVYVE